MDSSIDEMCCSHVLAQALIAGLEIMSLVMRRNPTTFDL